LLVKGYYTDEAVIWCFFSLTYRDRCRTNTQLYVANKEPMSRFVGQLSRAHQNQVIIMIVMMVDSRKNIGRNSNE
jgi:uncharacterized protein YcgL (UPF0745 family)